jgi:SAM-dependent methyltransferase
LVVHAPVGVAGRRVVDVGAGTGAATRAALAAGAADVIAVDVSVGMLRHDAPNRVPAVVADAVALPFGDGVVDGAVAAFSLNHLEHPGAGLREMARVSTPGSPLLAAAYAVDDAHPVKAAVEAALAERGWRPSAWYVDLRHHLAPLLATETGCRDALDDAGLEGTVVGLRVAFPELDAEALVRWRLGMAQHAPFFAGLVPGDRRAVVEDAVARLGGDPPPLVRSILVVAALSG